MLERTDGNADIDQQIRLVRECLRTALTHPPSLLYPLAKAILGVTAVVVVGTLLLSPVDGLGLDLGITPLMGGLLVACSLLVLYVLGPILGVALDVAYCYELHELLQGNRPAPGSGLAFAGRRLPAISLGALAVSASFLAGYVFKTESLRVGSGVLDLFLAPALAIENGTADEVRRRIEEVTTDQWGSAALTVYGVSTLGRVAGTLGIGVGVVIVVGGILGLFPVTVPQSLTLAVVIFLCGLGFVTFLTTLVTGPVSTTLYYDATSDRTPERLPLDVRDVARVE